MAALVSALLLSLYVCAFQAGTPPSSRPPVQFVLGDSALKKYATVAGNELTITAGAKKPYLSMATVTDFEIVGEVRLDDDADAALLLYAWEPEIASGPVFPLRLASSPRVGELSGPGVRASSDAKVAASFVAAARDWQPIRISCMGRHVRVVISGGLLTEGDLPSPQFGRIGIEVKKGSMSLRNWHFVRWDGPATRPLLDDNPGVIDAEVKPPPAGFTMPKLQQQVHPTYPSNAMRRKVRGEVELEAIVERNGYVGPIRVTKSLNHELDIEAIRALRQWRFAPALMNGEPVRCRVEIMMEFILK